MRRAPLALASLAVVAALVLSGCTSTDNETADKGGQEQAAGGGGAGDNQSGIATGQEGFQNVRELTSQLGTDAEPGEFPRTIKNITANETIGETEIPAKPARVVVLDSGELDNMIALGIQPIAYAHSESMTSMPDYLDAGDALDLGSYDALDLEQLKNLEPDLIIGTSLRIDDDGLKAKLQDIAPTVLAVRPGVTWKENFSLFAAAVGEEEKAAEILADYEEHVAEVGADVVEANGGEAPSISMLRFMAGRIRLYANDSFIGVILQDAGLKRPEMEDIEELAAEISPEEVTLAAGDWLFWGTYGEPDSTDQASVVDGPLWGEIPAVKNGGVVEQISDDIWYLGLGTLGAELVLDQLDEFADAAK